MLTKRVIACLDVADGKVVKGVGFRAHREVGEILSLAERYADQGVDELVFYDIKASTRSSRVSRRWVEACARRIDIPFCVAGGIRSLESAREVLASGADKVSVNTPALENPDFVDALVEAFGSQCIVIGIDSRRHDGDYWAYMYTGDTGKSCTSGRRSVLWAQEVARRGAGEVVLNCMDSDGVRKGYDIAQLQAFRRVLSIPLIASGGAGEMCHFAQVFQQTGVDAALAASVFHKNTISIPDLKAYLHAQGIPTRVLAENK